MIELPLLPLSEKYILDAACGSRLFYYDRKNKHVLYMDERNGNYLRSDGNDIEVRPDVCASFEAIPFPSESFRVVVFDPPHLLTCGDNSDLFKKYGRLEKDTWPQVIRAGFKECFRVLEKHGMLLFKWNEHDIKLPVILELCPYRPLLGTRTHTQTHFLTFLKEDDMLK